MSVNSDDVYRMIVRGDIHINLFNAPLAEPELVRVFLDPQASSEMIPVQSQLFIPKATCLEVKEGVRFLWDNKIWIITNVGEKRIWISGETNDSSLTHDLFEKYVSQRLITGIEDVSEESDRTCRTGLEMINNAEPKELKEAERRREVIAPYLNGEKKLRGVKNERTIRRWLRNYRLATELYGKGLVGLLPNYSGRGNTKRRLPDIVYRIMDDRIANDYETDRQKGMLAVWGAVLKDCDGMRINEGQQPSYVTFRNRVKSRSREEQVRKRQGKRAATKHEEFIPWLEYDTPRHGDRPFHIVHADHTELDIELVCPITGENLGRPWASFLVDAYSRRMLAVVVTFDPPSYRSVMMLLRECVRRHSRLPQTLVVDRGREFDNNYFRRLAAAFEITVKVRPSAKPRFGSVCERLFGIANKQFTHLLLGNTQIMTAVREVTKSISPKNLAVWTLGDFTQWFSAWAYVFYDQQPHWTLKESPAMAYARAVELTGRRRRMISHDETFRILTMPTTRKGTAKNVVDKGVKINSIYYRCRELRDRAIEGKQLLVRYDPFDVSTAFVYIKRKWVRCLSEQYMTFRYCTERQLKIASLEIRKKDSKLLRGRALHAKGLADFIASAELIQTTLANNRLLMQRVRDRECRPLIRFIDGATGEMYFAPQVIPKESITVIGDEEVDAGQGLNEMSPTQRRIDVNGIESCEDLH